MTATVLCPPAAAELDLSVLCLGASPALPLVLSTALGEDGETGELDGLLAVVEAWPGDAPPAEIASRLRPGLRGRSVGLIVVGEVEQAARNLAWLCAFVRRDGGVPVGAGVCVDPTDLVGSECGWAFADVTVAVRLVLLGRRVRTLARSRHILRAA